MENSKKSVQVVDLIYRRLEPTRPGKARKLLGSGKAKLLDEGLPLIQLQKKVFKKEDTKMDRRSIESYFKENDEVYVQNISGGVVSMSFYSGQRPEPFTLPNDRRPINLSDYMTKEIIKSSPDFRKLVMRRPPALRLLTVEQYENTIRKIAKETSKEPDDIVEEIAEKISKHRSKELEPLKEEKDSLKMDVMETPMDEGVEDNDLEIPGTADTGLNPRVLQIISQTSSLSENRMKASEVIDELGKLNLTVDEYNYVIGGCGYKTVVAWAQKRLSVLQKEQSEETTEKNDNIES